MGRELTKFQKKALDSYQDRFPSTISTDDMDQNAWNRIDNMRPCEVNWCNANRYLQDRRSMTMRNNSLHERTLDN